MADVKHTPDARTWSVEEAASLFPAYRMERGRLLSNVRCLRGLERRGHDTRPRMWHERGSLLVQRELATLRARWAGPRAAIAKAEAR